MVSESVRYACNHRWNDIESDSSNSVVRVPKPRLNDRSSWELTKGPSIVGNDGRILRGCWSPSGTCAGSGCGPSPLSLKVDGALDEDALVVVGVMDDGPSNRVLPSGTRWECPIRRWPRADDLSIGSSLIVASLENTGGATASSPIASS